MTGQILTVGHREHACHPGWEPHWNDGTGEMAPPAGWYLIDLHCTAGTVWECTCGQVWIAVAWPAHKNPYIFTGRISWRKERRRERRRRMRAGWQREPIEDPNSGYPMKGVR